MLTLTKRMPLIYVLKLIMLVTNGHRIMQENQAYKLFLDTVNLMLWDLIWALLMLVLNGYGILYSIKMKELQNNLTLKSSLPWWKHLINILSHKLLDFIIAKFYLLQEPWNGFIQQVWELIWDWVEKK